MQAWLRSRGEQGTTVFTADTMAEQFGVNKGSYDPVPLPDLTVHKVLLFNDHCNRMAKRHYTGSDKLSRRPSHISQCLQLLPALLV